MCVWRLGARNRAKTSFFYVSLSLFEWIDMMMLKCIYIHTSSSSSRDQYVKKLMKIYVR